jgi:RNA polymerase sigma-70 factor (ECF subfamily)
MHYNIKGDKAMLMFAFIYEDQAPKPEKYNNIDIDESLFKKIGQNDMEAFDQLYRLTERTMYAFSLSLVKDHQESLDLMQETYLKILSAAHLYKPMGKPLAWMFTIAKNLHYSSVRKGSRTTNLEPETIQDDKRFSYITDMDDKIVLQTVLDKLTEEEREIVLLYAVTGLKHKEIAESIGLSLSTTLSKYHRALKKLRGHLEEREVRA